MRKPKHKPLASCLYCRMEYLVFRNNRGETWCLCHGAQNERKQIKANYNQKYFALKQQAKPPKHKLSKPIPGNRGKYNLPGRINNRVNKCKVCCAKTVNRWYCPAHLHALTQSYDLDFMFA
jgi:hypothetical protein